MFNVNNLTEQLRKRTDAALAVVEKLDFKPVPGTYNLTLENGVEQIVNALIERFGVVVPRLNVGTARASVRAVEISGKAAQHVSVFVPFEGTPEVFSYEVDLGSNLRCPQFTVNTGAEPARIFSQWITIETVIADDDPANIRAIVDEKVKVIEQHLQPMEQEIKGHQATLLVKLRNAVQERTLRANVHKDRIAQLGIPLI